MTADLRLGIDGPDRPSRAADYDPAPRRQLDGADHG